MKVFLVQVFQLCSSKSPLFKHTSLQLRSAMIIRAADAVLLLGAAGSITSTDGERSSTGPELLLIRTKLLNPGRRPLRQSHCQAIVRRLVDTEYSIRQ